MELLAVIVALEQLKTNQYPVKVVSDSKYVIDAINLKWVYGWKLKGFKGKKNSDLWMRFLKVSEGLNVEYVWVRGHNGHPENERCDALAGGEMDKIQKSHSREQLAALLKEFKKTEVDLFDS